MSVKTPPCPECGETKKIHYEGGAVTLMGCLSRCDCGNTIADNNRITGKFYCHACKCKWVQVTGYCCPSCDWVGCGMGEPTDIVKGETS